MFNPETLNQKLAALKIGFVKGKVKLDHLHAATLSNSSMAPEAKEWCESYFKNKWIWSTHLNTDITTFYFEKKEDLLFFKLRYMGFLKE